MVRGAGLEPAWICRGFLSALRLPFRQPREDGARARIRTAIARRLKAPPLPIGLHGRIGVSGETRTPKATRSERAPYANSGQSHAHKNGAVTRARTWRLDPTKIALYPMSYDSEGAAFRSFRRRQAVARAIGTTPEGKCRWRPLMVLRARDRTCDLPITKRALLPLS